MSVLQKIRQVKSRKPPGLTSAFYSKSAALRQEKSKKGSLLGDQHPAHRRSWLDIQPLSLLLSLLSTVPQLRHLPI
jgi:hypothetical protein